MKKSYSKPRVTRYTREQIAAMIGPAKTQYPPPPPPPPPAECSCQGPIHALVWKEFVVAPLPISVDFGGCPAFIRAEVEISSGGQRVALYPFDRSAGNEFATRWQVTINNFTLDGTPGQVFDVAVTLYAENGSIGHVCQSTITLQGF
ncbi:MAG TPA: hypothetical protein PKC67_14435 [Kiritimatiellia bacterium]|nr:hypothetical protein [Kiritimatiellia bacterium]HMP35534.1 hypothetical protein [Kiritimatiellia bacterium]